MQTYVANKMQTYVANVEDGFIEAGTSILIDVPASRA